MAAERTITVRLRMAHEQYRRALAEASADTSRFAAHANAALSSAGNTRQVGEQMTRTVTLPLVGLGVAATKLGVDFDETFTRMTTLAGVAASEVDGLKKQVLALAGETARGPQELAEGLYFASSAGLDTKTSMELVEQSAKAAAIGLGSTAVVVDAVTSALGAYGTANLTSAQAIDVLVAGARIAKTEAAELAPQLGRLLPTAQALGVGFDQVVASLGYLSTKSGDAGLSATQLDGVLRKLLVPSEQGRKALEGVGLSAERLRNIVATGGLPAALDVLRAKFGGNSDALFKLFDDIQAFQGAQLLLADSTGQLGSAFEATKNSAGAAGEAFDDTASTKAFKMRQSLAEAKVALIDLGASLAPLVTSLAAFGAALLAVFGSLPDWLQSSAAGFLVLAATIGPVMSVAGRLAEGFSTLARTASTAFDRTAVGAYNAAGNLAMVGSGLAAAGGAALIATAVFKHYADEKARMAKLTNDFTEALKRERDGLQGESSAVIGSKLIEGGIGEKLRGIGVDLTLFTDGIKTSSAEVERFSMLAEQYGTRDGGLFAKALADAAAAGSPLAIELQRIRETAGLSAGEMKTLMMRVSDASDAFKSAEQNVENEAYATEKAGKSADAASASLFGMAGGLDALGDEAAFATARTQTLLDMIAALTTSTTGVLDAQLDFADAVDAVGRAGASTGGSVRDLTSQQRALERATLDVADAQQDLLDAETALEEARKGPSDREKKDASLDVRDAQLGLAEAQRSVADAQKRVTEERKKGREGDVKGATLDLQRAQLQLERSQLRVRDAQAAQNEVLTSGADTSAKVRDALDTVTAAQERVADAQQRVTDAEADLRRESATGGPVADRNRQIAGSLDRVAESGQKVIDKMIEQRRPYQEITAEIDTQMRKIDELISKYGDVNGKLKTRIDLLLVEKYLMGGVNVDPFRGTADLFAAINATLPGRATGGPVSAGKAYKVGEYGRPEVFIPGVSGTVAPITSAAGYATGGGSGTLTIERPLQVVVGDQVLVDVLAQASYDRGGLDLKIRNR